MLAQVLWELGYPDQARKRIDETLNLARELTHPFSLAIALVRTGALHQNYKEGKAAQEQAEALITLSTEQGFSYWLLAGTIWRGWALAVQGQEEEGLTDIRHGLSVIQTTGTTLFQPYCLGLLAEVEGQAGQVEAGLSTLAEALELVAKTGERFHHAELYRLKGVLTLQAPSPSRADHVTEAEACFQQALNVARQQEAKSWELRAVTSLARLWQQQGKEAKARDLLAPVYDWFTEGFDTADLKDAKALLDSLS